jgi:predicted DNA-binding protein YlxM (UPF0122 family)
MAAENVLDKTNRINQLFDFYEPLLTEKQQTFLKLYFHDNYTLGEIAEEFAITRQAVYEHIKRAEFMLGEYEDKLHMLAQYEQRNEYITEIQLLVEQIQDQNKDKIKNRLDKLAGLE